MFCMFLKLIRYLYKEVSVYREVTQKAAFPMSLIFTIPAMVSPIFNILHWCVTSVKTDEAKLICFY